MKNFTFALMILSLFFYTSCVKEVGTSNSNVVFQLNTATSPVSGAAITWTIGSAGITAASIQGRKNDSAIVIFKSDVKAAVDLFGAVNFANVSVPVGKYRNVAFKIDLQDIGGKSPLRLEGTFKAGTTVTPIVFEASGSFSIQSLKDSIVIGSSTTNYNATTTIGAITLTQDITEPELKAATLTSGKIIISPLNNTPIYNKMMANLAKPQILDFH